MKWNLERITTTVSIPLLTVIAIILQDLNELPFPQVYQQEPCKLLLQASTIELGFLLTSWIFYWFEFKAKRLPVTDRQFKEELIKLPKQARTLLAKFINGNTWIIDVPLPPDSSTNETWRLECDSWSILQSRQFVRSRMQGGQIIGYSIESDRIWRSLQKYRKLLS